MYLALIALLHVHACHLKRTFLHVGLNIPHYIVCDIQMLFPGLGTNMLHVFDSNNVTQSDRMQCSTVTYCFDSCAHFLRPQKIHHVCQVSEVCNTEPGIR